MELKIKNKRANIVILRIARLKEFFLVLIMCIVLSLLAKSLLVSTSTIYIFVATILVLYFIISALNIRAMIRKQVVSLEENSIDLKSGDLFGNSDVSIPFTLITSVEMTQGFIEKTLKVCELHILQANGRTTSIRGYGVDEIRAFIEKFAQVNKVKVGK